MHAIPDGIRIFAIVGGILAARDAALSDGLQRCGSGGRSSEQRAQTDESQTGSSQQTSKCSFHVFTFWVVDDVGYP